MPISLLVATAASVTHVNASATSVTLLADNPDRKCVSAHNDSTATLYLAYAATASTTDYTVKISPGSYWEMPSLYTGVISGLWSSANGAARLTEGI